MLIGRSEYSQEGVYVGEVIVDGLESVGLVVELREPMAGTVDDAEDLRHREHEVEDLREEEEKHGLREVTEDAYHGKGHSREVAECIAHKHLRGEFVVLDESKRHHDEGYDDRQREYVLRDNHLRDGQVDFLQTFAS